MSSSTIIIRQTFLYYGPGSCALCCATGLLEGTGCPSCKGKGYVVVRRPSPPCTCCKGGGRLFDSGALVEVVCSSCNGSGWMITHG
jgi:hypothetical protein